MKKITIISATCLVLVCFLFSGNQAQAGKRFFAPDHPYIGYMGRIDFSNKKLPRFWQPGVCISIKFKGPACDVMLNDEVLWGTSHNYIEIVIDGKPYRIQTKAKKDTIKIQGIKGSGVHNLLVCKNTEANIGYLELAGFRCKQLLKPNLLPPRKIEFIGNSITCGMGNDISQVPCKTKQWYDQHNAWLSYGALTARALKSQFHLSAVSGIGLMHSCCNLDILMPQVYDKISMRDNKILWDFKRYQPDIVSICLGQNDGIQDAATFCKAYISFIKTLRGYYPGAKFILLSSPMADDGLRKFMKTSLAAIAETLRMASATAEESILR